MAVVAMASNAWAVDTSSCTPPATYNSWVNNTLVNGAASAPAADTSFIPVGRPSNCLGPTPCGRVYFAKGTTLYSFEDRGLSAALVWTWTLPSAFMGENSGTTISNFPSPTPGDSLHPLVVYLGGANGRLYKIDGQNGCNPGGSPACQSNPGPLLTADLRRKDANGALICNTAPGDGINATPAVLLNSYSSAGGAFQTFASAQGHPGADLVFAATFDGCSDSTHNAVYALWSDDFTVQWVFQGSDTGPKVDAFTEGCELRYDRGPRTTCGSDFTCADPNDPMLFCGTLQKVSVTGQDSVFELNAITTNANKRVIWSHNAGSVANRPMLNNNTTLGQRVYVSNQGGTMFAYGPDGNGVGGPDLKWSYAVAPGSSINRSPWIEPRGGTFKDKILVLDTAGVLRAFQDNGTSIGPLWAQTATGTATWISLPIVLPGSSHSYAYVGRNDGYLQQVDLASGEQGGRQQVDSAGGGSAFAGDLVFDPSLDLQDSLTFNVNRAYVVDDGGTTNHSIKRFNLPFCTDSGGSGAATTCAINGDGTNNCNGGAWPDYNPCVAAACDNATGSSRCETGHATPGGNGSLSGGTVPAPDGTACDDGSACTRATSPPAPIACTTNDDCPHADVYLQQCQCVGGTQNPCATFGHGAACTTDDSSATGCADPLYQRCDTNAAVLACEALCPATTVSNPNLNLAALPTVANVCGASNATNVLTVSNTWGAFPPAGQIYVLTNAGQQLVTYTSLDKTHFCGVTGGAGNTGNGANFIPTVTPGATFTSTTSGGTLPLATVNVATTSGYPNSGYITVVSDLGPQTVAYAGLTGTSFTGCTGGNGTVSTGAAVSQTLNLCPNCTTKIERTYFMKCVANQCVCNGGAGVNCNDVCIAGVCTGANKSSCQCLTPGDPSCASGTTCCGQNNGGCVDIGADPQHCGACGTDCGTYTAPVSTSVGAGSNGITLPIPTLNVASTSAFPSSGSLLVSSNAGVQTVTYTGTTSTTFTGCTGGSGVLGTGGVVLPAGSAACSSNNDCGSCANDGACQSMGLNSKCEDIIGGTGHCGKCSVDCSCFFNSDCTNKGYVGAVCSGASFPNTLGTCTGGTPACAGYCKRLVGTGACSNGQCTTCGGSGSCACDSPSLTDLMSSAPVGLSGLAFERIAGSTPQVCGAYASTYVDNVTTQNTACGTGCAPGSTCVGSTCQAISLERIAKGSVVTPYTSTNFHPQEGVAVPLSGWEVLGNFIANTSNPSPGLAERPNAAITFSNVLSSMALPPTGADNPFRQTKLNDAMVGPALDYTIFTDKTATTHQTYFGNFNKPGDVTKVVNNGVAWIPTSLASYLPSQVSCGGGCGAAVVCDSPSTGHPKTCNATPDCAASGAASTCVAGHCRCSAPQTCDVNGACACVAPATCSTGVCACPGPGETCSAGVCTCTSDTSCATGQACVNGRCAQRVTAITTGQFNDSSKGPQRHLFIGHGSTLSIIDLATGAQTDVNLATAYVPQGGNQATVNGILGIAVHPQYGDILVEVKGTNNYRYLLNVDGGDNSVRHELTVQQALQRTQNPTSAVPLDFGQTADGHIVFMPDGNLLRFAPVVNGAPTDWAIYKVSK
jgi:hypothetical protein